VLFTAPTAFRAIKKEDPNGDYLKTHHLSGFRALFLAGERLDPDTYHWARALLQKPVVDHWWQTETGWPVAANCLGLEPLPTKPGSPTKPVPGWQVEIVGDDGQPLPADKEGAVVIRLPLPPGTVPTLWQDDERFKDVYLSRFPGYYTTGDGGYFDEDGYLYIMGRIDDVIIVAGHNLSTGSMEEAISSHKDVAECAVFGVKDALKTQLPLGLIVLKAGVSRDHRQVVAELLDIVREQVGPVANFKVAGVVSRLPKTRSGKILRGTMRQIADGEPYKVPSTIDDPAILDEVKAVLKDLGYAREPRGEIAGGARLQ
jgi:propionyl-CoA synthetase